MLSQENNDFRDLRRELMEVRRLVQGLSSRIATNEDTAEDLRDRIDVLDKGKVADSNDAVKCHHIAWGQKHDDVNAVQIPIRDSAGKYTARTVEGALAELPDGSGTADYIPLWTDSDTLGNSIIQQEPTTASRIGIGVTPETATLDVLGNLYLSTITNAATDTDAFLCSDGGEVKYRTGTEVLSDIGAIDGSGTTNYHAKWSDSDTLTDSIIIDDGTNIGVNEASPATQIEMTGSAPYITLHNSTGGDVRRDRKCRILARGHQSGDEESVLGYIEFSHDNISNNDANSRDDQTGRISFYVNDGNDDTEPVHVMTLMSTFNWGVDNDPQEPHVGIGVTPGDSNTGIKGVLHVREGSGAGNWSHWTAGKPCIAMDSDDDVVLRMVTTPTKNCELRMGDGDNIDRACLRYNNNSDEIGLECLGQSLFCYDSAFASSGDSNGKSFGIRASGVAGLIQIGGSSLGTHALRISHADYNSLANMTGLGWDVYYAPGLGWITLTTVYGGPVMLGSASNDAQSGYWIVAMRDRSWNNGVGSFSAIVVRGTKAIGFFEEAPVTAIEYTHASPYFTLHNDTEEDADGGRESRILARGEQSGGEESVLGYMEFSHDGASDDEQGKFELYLNDGNDGESPGLGLKIDSAKNATFQGNVDLASGKVYKVNGTQVVGAQGAALTAQDTTITHTAPGTPDYIVQDLVTISSWGFADHDEGNTVLKVVANLQTRLAEVESRMQAHGLIA